MKITVFIVAYNEETYLPRLIGDLRAQTYPHEQIEVIFVDSASTDRTREVMDEFAAEGGFAGVQILENPKKRISIGCNIALRAFLDEKNDPSEAVVRVDAHARIPEDFIESCVEALADEDVVGGPRPTVCESDGAWARTLWMAEESMFGSSVSSARRETGDEKTYVKAAFHAAMRREVVADCGLYREDLGRTEDNDLFYRLGKNGYKVCRSSKIYSEQYIRPTLRKMLRQKAGNGYWIGRTLGIVPGCISLYHLVPLAFLLAIITSGVLAICVSPWCLQLLGALYGSVAVLMAVYAAFSLQREGDKVPIPALLLPVIFFCLHISYGCGTLIGVLSIPFGRRKAND
ncbi:MAG: glycosyltransferase family 2 protein [Eubacterium sp.]|nr:glycosyltransferase family 2 protein [Eubacterium sp.]